MSCSLIIIDQIVFFKIHMLKPEPLVPQDVTAFRDRAFKKVIESIQTFRVD